MNFGCTKPGGRSLSPQSVRELQKHNKDAVCEITSKKGKKLYYKRPGAAQHAEASQRKEKWEKRLKEKKYSPKQEERIRTRINAIKGLIGKNKDKWAEMLKKSLPEKTGVEEKSQEIEPREKKKRASTIERILRERKKREARILEEEKKWRIKKGLAPKKELVPKEELAPKEEPESKELTPRERAEAGFWSPEQLAEINRLRVGAGDEPFVVGGQKESGEELTSEEKKKRYYEERDRVLAHGIPPSLLSGEKKEKIREMIDNWPNDRIVDLHQLHLKAEPALNISSEQLNDFLRTMVSTHEYEFYPWQLLMSEHEDPKHLLYFPDSKMYGHLYKKTARTPLYERK